MGGHGNSYALLPSSLAVESEGGVSFHTHRSVWPRPDPIDDSCAFGAGPSQTTLDLPRSSLHSVITDQAFDIVAREFHILPILLVYVIGITSTVWHFANGIWLFLVDWGITIGARAQRLAGYACIAFGAVLLLVGINAMVAFIRPGGLLKGIL